MREDLSLLRYGLLQKGSRLLQKRKEKKNRRRKKETREREKQRRGREERKIVFSHSHFHPRLGVRLWSDLDEILVCCSRRRELRIDQC
jgi:hypothetical protein